MRTFATRIICTAAAFALFVPSTGRAQSTGASLEATALLARPISPGAIALLAEHSSLPGVQGRLAEALKHPNPNVRAAASRVIFVAGFRDLVPAVSAALTAEQDSHAAFEEARVVANFSGASQDSMILDAASRIGSVDGLRAAIVIAGSRGEAAIDLWPRLGSGEVAGARRADFLRIATRGSSSALAALASRAVRDRDLNLAKATIQAAVDARVDLGDEILASMLATVGADDLRMVGVQHLVRSWNGRSGLSEPVRSALTRLLDAASPSADGETMLLMEVLSRALGRAPRADAAWRAMLAAPPDSLRTAFQYQSVRRVLTGSELQIVSRALYGDADRISPIRSDTPEPAPASSPRQDQALVRVAAGYPPGMMSDAFVVAGCDLRKMRDGIATGGELTLRREGRVQQVAVIDVQAPPACMAVARALLITYATDIDRLIEEGQRELLVLPFDSDFVMCHESYTSWVLTAEGVGRPGRQIAAPRKTRDVRPVYPPTAQAERVQGTVVIESHIAPTGCIAKAAVLRSVDPRLDWAATRAVLGWRFTPTLLNGQPVPVIMAISVQFNLN